MQLGRLRELGLELPVLSRLLLRPLLVLLLPLPPLLLLLRLGPGLQVGQPRLGLRGFVQLGRLGLGLPLLPRLQLLPPLRL